MNAIVLALIVTAAAPSFRVQTLDGQTKTGHLVQWDDHRIVIDEPNGASSFDADQVLSITADGKAPAVSASHLAVGLTDGSLLHARQFQVKNGQAVIDLAHGESLEAPIGAVRSVQLQRELGASADSWNRLMTLDADSDLLVIRKGQSLDYHKGILRDVTDEVVQFDLDGELLPVKRSKVVGFVYRHPESRDSLAPLCRITDASGSQWAVRSFTFGETLRWTTSSGLSVAQPLRNITKIDFSGGKIVYLSDLKPDQVRWTPYFAGGKTLPSLQRFYAPRFDQGFNGKPLQLGGVAYAKGLALNSRTETVYSLPEGIRSFRAVAGIDDAVRPAGEVRLAIRGDDKTLLETVVSGKDAPKTIDLDLTGVGRLTVLVDFGENRGVGDCLLLCNARLVK